MYWKTLVATFIFVMFIGTAYAQNSAETNATIEDSSITIEIGGNGQVNIIDGNENSLGDQDPFNDDQEEPTVVAKKSVLLGILTESDDLQGADTLIALMNPTVDSQEGELMVGNKSIRVVVQAFETGTFSLSELQDEDGFYQISIRNNENLVIQAIRLVGKEFPQQLF